MVADNFYKYGLVFYFVAMITMCVWFYHKHGHGPWVWYFGGLGVLGVLAFLYVLQNPLKDAVVFNLVLGIHFLGVAYVTNMYK